MHRFSSMFCHIPSALFSSTKLSYKLANPLFVLLILIVQADPASAADKFNYSAGAIEFAKQQFFIGSPTSEFKTFIVDLNGDDASDVLVAGLTLRDMERSGPQPGLILFNNGDNTFTVAEGDAPGSEEAREVLTADFNGDGILDIYIADHGYDTDPFPGFKNQLLLGTGGGFTDVSDRLPDIEAFTHNGAIGDIDGDGDIDILSLNSTPGDPSEELSYFLINDGNANFTLNRERLPDSLVGLDPSLLRQSFAAELADLDGDGLPELIIGRREFPESSFTRIHWNDGFGFYSDAEVTILPDADVFGGVEKIAVNEIKGTDINGDGLIDLLLLAVNQFTFNGISMQLFINQGNREFEDETLTRLTNAVQDPSPDLSTPIFTQFADLNGDGITDILPLEGGGKNDGGILLFEGTGEGCFTPVTNIEVSDDPEVRARLGDTPLISPDAIGFASFSVWEGVINIDYVPLVIQPAAPIANLFNSCRGKLEVNVDIDGESLFALDFSIFSSTPDVVIQAEPSTARELTESMENLAIFNTSSGSLILPELVIDGEVSFRNLEFQLTDEERFLFTLISFE